MRLLLGLAGLVSLATPASGAPLRLVDLTDKFDKVATATRGMSDKARVAAFEKAMTPLADGFYSRKRNPDRYDQKVLKNLAAYPAERDRILTAARQFDGLFFHARPAFEKAFGRVSSRQPIYLVHSLGEMDGGTRELHGKDTLLFGADVIARIHDSNDMEPFLHHELFHLWHEPRFGKCEPAWCSLWEEGMATYVAARLNPQAGEAALMLSQPAPVRPGVDKDLPAAVCAAMPLLSSKDEKVYGKLFYGNAYVDGFPARMGYYLGYLVAADLGKTRTLKQLAVLTPKQVEPLVRASLKQMAPDCRAR
jgi:hypothetical protein